MPSAHPLLQAARRPDGALTVCSHGCRTESQPASPTPDRLSARPAKRVAL